MLDQQVQIKIQKIPTLTTFDLSSEWYLLTLIFFLILNEYVYNTHEYLYLPHCNDSY